MLMRTSRRIQVEVLRSIQVAWKLRKPYAWPRRFRKRRQLGHDNPSRLITDSVVKSKWRQRQQDCTK